MQRTSFIVTNENSNDSINHKIWLKMAVIGRWLWSRYFIRPLKKLFLRGKDEHKWSSYRQNRLPTSAASTDKLFWGLIKCRDHDKPPYENLYLIRAKIIKERLHSVKNNSNFKITALFPPPHSGSAENHIVQKVRK